MAACFLLAAVAIQIAAGAFQSERGLYSDEAAHFMNGLLIRDYLREGLGTSPLAFAREYYQSYPKIAPLMWPPLFHGVLGLALLPGWSPTPVAILLLGACMAWAAWRLYFLTLECTSTPVALGVAGLLLATPAVVSLSSSVMVDIVIATLALEASFWLGRYWDTLRTSHAATFGLMTALACLAKGNGLSVVMAPLFMLILSGRLDILGRAGLYVAGAIVVVLAAPFLAIAYNLDAALGDFGPLSLGLVLERLKFYSLHIWLQLGTLPLVLAGVGIVAVLARPAWLARAARFQGLALLSTVLGALAFHLFSPHLLSHERYITLALAPILGLSAFGVMTMTRSVASPAARRSTQLVMFLVMAAAHFTTQPLPKAQAPLGYRSVVSFLAQHQDLAGKRMLIVSNEQGEGACVVEVAVLNLRPRPMVIRGSKLLASDDWMGRNLQMRYASADAALDDLEAMHVDFVILDDSAESMQLPYWTQVKQIADRFPDRLQRVLATSETPRTGPLRPLSVYRVTQHTKSPAKPIPLNLPAFAVSGPS
jgi:hypothetical protein